MQIAVRDAGAYVEHTHEEVVAILGFVKDFDAVKKLTDLVTKALKGTKGEAFTGPIVMAIKWLFESQFDRIRGADKGNGVTVLMPWGWLVLGWFWFFEVNTRPGAPAIQQQDDWRHCHRCTALFWAGQRETAGICPADGQPHDKTVSGNYTLMHDVTADPGQHDWRFCTKCNVLYFSGGAETSGVCPAGGQHGNRSASGDYSLAYDSPSAPGQAEWRWCGKCAALFHAGASATAGTCPGGGAHEKTFSSDYTLGHTA